MATAKDLWQEYVRLREGVDNAVDAQFHRLLWEGVRLEDAVEWFRQNVLQQTQHPGDGTKSRSGRQPSSAG